MVAGQLPGVNVRSCVSVKQSQMKRIVFGGRTGGPLVPVAEEQRRAAEAQAGVAPICRRYSFYLFALISHFGQN